MSTAAPEPAERDWNQCLVEVGQGGNKEQFMAFYRHFAPRLKAWLIGQGGQRDQAEELAQEAMLKAWRHAPSFDPSKASASTWLYTIARNLLSDLGRKQQREQKFIARQSAEQEAMPAVEQAQWQMPELDRQQLAAALKQLPNRQAQVIYQCFYQGRSHSEIAANMGLPLGSVKSSLRLG
ncbi:MAG: sigma-70 family RNA polymerase sigma factor, partial [Cellvibrionaceae bacterium]|nr:sigma-70 family RNA polymerase sigma factor [Cellvibrionaceae bacterium]